MLEGKQVGVAASLAHFGLVVPDGLHGFAVPQARLRLTQRDEVGHLLQVLVAVRALARELVFFVALALGLVGSLLADERLVLLLLLFVHVAAPREALEDLLGRGGHLRPLALCILVLLISEFLDLTFQSAAQRVLHNRSGLSRGLILNSLHFESVL